MDDDVERGLLPNGSFNSFKYVFETMLVMDDPSMSPRELAIFLMQKAEKVGKNAGAFFLKPDINGIIPSTTLEGLMQGIVRHVKRTYRVSTQLPILCIHHTRRCGVYVVHAQKLLRLIQSKIGQDLVVHDMLTFIPPLNEFDITRVHPGNVVTIVGKHSKDKHVIMSNISMCNPLLKSHMIFDPSTQIDLTRKQLMHEEYLDEVLEGILYDRSQGSDQPQMIIFDNVFYHSRQIESYLLHSLFGRISELNIIVALAIYYPLQTNILLDVCNTNFVFCLRQSCDINVRKLYDMYGSSLCDFDYFVCMYNYACAREHACLVLIIDKSNGKCEAFVYNILGVDEEQLG